MDYSSKTSMTYSYCSDFSIDKHHNLAYTQHNNEQRTIKIPFFPGKYSTFLDKRMINFLLHTFNLHGIQYPKPKHQTRSKK